MLNDMRNNNCAVISHLKPHVSVFASFPDMFLSLLVYSKICLQSTCRAEKNLKMKRKSMQSDRKKTRERSRQRCGHCQQLLSHSQYHLHRRLYYNSSLDNWKTVEDLKRSSVPVDVPGSSSSESEFEGTSGIACARMLVYTVHLGQPPPCRYVSVTKLPLEHAGRILRSFWF